MRNLSLSILVLMTACASNGTNPSSGILEPPPDDQGLQLSLVHRLSPGEEIHWCKYVVLETAIDVARFEHAYSSGSHHVLAYTTPLHAADVAGMSDFSCENGMNETFNGVAYTGAVPEGSLELPDGVGFHFDADAVILLEGHYLNATDAPLEVPKRYASASGLRNRLCKMTPAAANAIPMTNPSPTRGRRI